ncbi:MAG: class II aldolase/adducin family protein [Chloroflexi bacterium]|nr:class II aldolase/adducin family protein [Chloroflexota bacterium]
MSTVRRKRTPIRWAAQRRALLAAAKAISRQGLVAGTSGNLSMRLEPGFYLVTPTSMPYEDMTGADLVAVDEQLEPVGGDGVPSSESLLHIAVYRARSDVGAVAHTHSIYASAVAAAGNALPPVLDEVVVQLGGAIECADYGPPASEDLARNAVKALGDRRAVLLRNHGVVGVGKTPAEAVNTCALVERVAQVYLFAKLAGGPRPLPAEVIGAEAAIYRMRSGL